MFGAVAFVKAFEVVECGASHALDVRGLRGRRCRGQQGDQGQAEERSGHGRQGVSEA